MSTETDTPLSSVFIVEPTNEGWIIERLMRDVAAALDRRGIVTHIGPARDYAGEHVIFNSRYLQPYTDVRARVTSGFVTHVDDRIRELELRNSLPKFDSVVCLSEHDAGFVAGLKGTERGVIGLDLPPRDQNVRPARLGLFSARYPDGRKNENWILEYFAARDPSHRGSFVFCFLGADWESFLVQLAGLDLNFEAYRYARALPGEYEMYKRQLPTLDALIYLGFDGGAMSSYDAAAAGIDLIISDISYHRNLDDRATLLATRDDFFKALDAIHRRISGMRAKLAERSIDKYVERLLEHWQQVDGAEPSSPRSAAEQEGNNHSDDLVEFRSRYKPLSFSRIRSALIRLFLARFS